jgi:hypothetical protein
MRIGGRPDRGRRHAAGFSLLEVAVAAGLLLLTIATVTACVTSVSRGGARLQAAMDADRAVRAVAERLLRLPYCAAAYPDPGGSRGSAATDLVAAVFPHARVSENTEGARYVAIEEGGGVAPGSFVTLAEEGRVSVRCVASFLSGEGGAALGAAELDGWSAGEGTAPPAAVLEVRVTATDRGAVRETRVTVCALTKASPGRRASVAGAAP